MVTPDEVAAAWNARRARTRDEELLDRLDRELRARWVPGDRPLYVPIGGQSKAEIQMQLAACREAGWTVRAQSTGFGTTLVFGAELPATHEAPDVASSHAMIEHL